MLISQRMEDSLRSHASDLGWRWGALKKKNDVKLSMEVGLSNWYPVGGAGRHSIIGIGSQAWEILSFSPKETEA